MKKLILATLIFTAFMNMSYADSPCTFTRTVTIPPGQMFAGSTSTQTIYCARDIVIPPSKTFKGGTFKVEGLEPDTRGGHIGFCIDMLNIMRSSPEMGGKGGLPAELVKAAVDIYFNDCNK
jgi:hypothetical protein